MGSQQKFKVEILSAESTIYQGEIDCLLVPSAKGQVAVLPFHAPMIIIMSEGDIFVILGRSKKKIATVKKGVVRVDDNEVFVLVNL